MIYQKLKRTWSNGYVNYMPEFIEAFPELKSIDSEELCDRLRDLNMDFYYEEETPVKPWVRLTLPFALILIVLMFIGLPVNFMFTGKWGYSLGKKNRIFNWLQHLKLQ